MNKLVKGCIIAMYIFYLSVTMFEQVSVCVSSLEFYHTFSLKLAGVDGSVQIIESKPTLSNLSETPRNEILQR